MKFEQEYFVNGDLGQYSNTIILEVDDKAVLIREKDKNEAISTIHITPQIAKHLYLMLKEYYS